MLEGVVARRGLESLLERLALPADDAAAVDGARFLACALAENAAFQAATLRVSATSPRFYRYESGNTCGEHAKSPLMVDARGLRADIAVAIALNDADSYAGGELVVGSPVVAQRWKGRVGDCLVYPASMPQRMEPVTRGERSVAMLWLQSAIRAANQRSLLFELWQAAEALSTVRAPERDVERVRASRAELLRMWSER